MIKNNFTIDYNNKIISYRSGMHGTIIETNVFYTYLQNLFASEQNIKYPIPIIAMTKTDFYLINGWTIDDNARSHLKDGSITVSTLTTEN